MADRERLIELIKNAPTTDTVYGNIKIPNRIQTVQTIADYLLKNGVIVPPCKVGDTVYVVENPYTFLTLKKVLEGNVISIHQHEHGLYLRVLFDTKKINGSVDYNLNWKLGKTVFLTKEQAEKALKEREASVV